MELQPAPLASVKAAPKPARRGMLGALAGVALLCSVALGIGAIVGHASSPDQPLSQAEQAARALAIAQAGTIRLSVIKPVDQAAAITSLNLPPEQARELAQRVDNGAEKLVWLTLWDDCVEDNDTVELQSYGVTKVVRLVHAPQRVAMPAPAGGVINVRGVYDGGGGITVAIMSGDRPVSMPIMSVGQVLGVPVSVSP